MFRVYQFLVAYVVASTALPIYLHNAAHGSVPLIFAAQAFFLPLNILICFWEIGLGLHINHIQKDYDILRKQYPTNPLSACGAFFMLPLTIANMFSLKFWGRVWST